MVHVPIVIINTLNDIIEEYGNLIQRDILPSTKLIMENMGNSPLTKTGNTGTSSGHSPNSPPRSTP